MMVLGFDLNPSFSSIEMDDSKAVILGKNFVCSHSEKKWKHICRIPFKKYSYYLTLTLT